MGIYEFISAHIGPVLAFISAKEGHCARSKQAPLASPLAEYYWIKPFKRTI